ncbi:MAG: KamA family radical SAM protein [Sphaerochaetaceae bacterium]|jgi:lysine 2,3-aminomutase|nr:KamA family radical SAM protein [Sphaerochaetaceae bacterium]MDD3942452.1 KamA family radical SAM protein [Sphaerochaetaceae bacterium]MDX9939580.1 KamA family radical SAM protein [Sphaerochaetaceae bacterium]
MAKPAVQERKERTVEQVSAQRIASLDDEPPLKRKGVEESLATPRTSRSGIPGSSLFRKQFFPNTSSTQWNDWHWQLFHRITTGEQLLRFLEPTESEHQALQRSDWQFPFSVTPYYLSLINLQDPEDPLRKTVIPHIAESIVSDGEALDPLGEDHTSPVPGIVHRYPDRALFLATSFCSVYCRYCTRSRLVGGHTEALEEHWDRALDYLASHTEIRDVIISGGDPLTLSDERLEKLLARFRQMKHIQMLRIGTKVPFVLPQRVTPALVKVLKSYRPLYINIHATHPHELSEEGRQACNRLSDAGIVLGSQTVLLKGVNDSVEVMTDLFHSLLKVRVRPYYLFQCDPIVGSAHFRTTIEDGKAIMDGLRGHTSGLAIPYYVVDTPGGGGKVPVLPDYEVSHDAKGFCLRNYEGKRFMYPDAKPEA